MEQFRINIECIRFVERPLSDMQPVISSPSVRPPRPYEISVLNYGSEDEYNDEEDDIIHPIVVPHLARMFMDGEVKIASFRLCSDFPRLNCPSVRGQMPASSFSTLPSPVSPMHASLMPASPIPTEPSNKFLFEWTPLSTPEIKPDLRREPFSQINSGPTVSFSDPYDAFTAIWDRKIMEVIVTETNIYAQQLATAMLENGSIVSNNWITRWKDTNVNELYIYFALVVATGVMVIDQMDEYWDMSPGILSIPGFSSEMSYDRFQLLSKCLHFNNNQNCDSELLTRPQAKVFKIQPILDHLNSKFSHLYNLSQNVALDESLTIWLDANVDISNKTYEVCEPETGYLWRFEVHADHDTSAQGNDPASWIIQSLVLRLLNGLEHKGHTIWMDKFYTSPALARELKVLGFDCVGTLRTNRQFVPSELAAIRKKDLTVGQVVGYTSGDVDLMVWRGKKLAAFISTYHGLATTRYGNKLKPTIVDDYVNCMYKLDRKDRLLETYPIERRRSLLWYKKLFRRLLNVSVLNSYILLNHSLPHLDFRKALVTQLLAAHRTHIPTLKNMPKVVHGQAQYDLKPGKPYRLKRPCAVCNKRTTTYCKACNVPMCAFTCYMPYHESQ